MGYITIKNRHYKELNLEVLTFNTNNFRVISALKEKEIFVVTSTLLGVVLENLSVNEFLEIHSTEEYAATFGYPYSFFNLCNKCGGRGTLSWMDKIVGVSNRKLGIFDGHEFEFVKNKMMYHYEGTICIDDTTYNALYQISELIDGDEYCDKCFGTGIHLNGKILKLKEDYTTGPEMGSPLNNQFKTRIKVVKRTLYRKET